MEALRWGNCQEQIWMCCWSVCPTEVATLNPQGHNIHHSDMTWQKSQTIRNPLLLSDIARLHLFCVRLHSLSLLLLKCFVSQSIFVSSIILIVSSPCIFYALLPVPVFPAFFVTPSFEHLCLIVSAALDCSHLCSSALLCKVIFFPFVCVCCLHHAGFCFIVLMFLHESVAVRLPQFSGSMSRSVSVLFPVITNSLPFGFFLFSLWGQPGLSFFLIWNK